MYENQFKTISPEFISTINFVLSDKKAVELYQTVYKSN